MPKFEQNMNNIFDVEIESSDLPAVIEPKEIIQHETLDEDLKKDYEIIRENFHEMIEKGKEAFDDILAIARDSEKGRDMEVAATVFKNVLDANQQLLDIHKRIREITNYKQTQSSSDKTTINNALFVGSTSELSKMLKELRKDEVIDHE